VSYLEESFEGVNDARVTYIYCNYKESNQIATNLIASILQQLVQTDAEVSKEIHALYTKHITKQTRPTFDEFSILLQSEARRFSKLFVVIDALDECTESDGTRGRLLTELQKLQPMLHLLVTARPHIRNVVDIFQDASLLEICATQEDIMMYIQGRIKTESKFKRHISLEDKIITAILGSVQGMSVSQSSDLVHY
jgi:hypothetical protein